MKLAVVSDFDATLTKKDVGDSLLIEFKKADIKEIELSYQMGFKVEEWMKIYFSRMKDIPFTEIERFVIEKVEPRDGFLDFFSFLTENKIPFEIVSGGVDAYIEPFFKKYAISPKGFYGIFKDGVVSYPFLGDMTLSQFKASRVVHYKNLGYAVVFLGDSQNDYEASLVADIRFATLRLKDILAAKKESFFSFETLNEVLEKIYASLPD